MVWELDVIDLRDGSEASDDPFLGSELESGGPLEDRLRGGVAIMAHEVRGPLLAAQAAISRGLSLMEGSPETRTLLVRTLDELRALADRIDHLLAWGAGLTGMELRVT